MLDFDRKTEALKLSICSECRRPYDAKVYKRSELCGMAIKRADKNDGVFNSHGYCPECAGAIMTCITASPDGQAICRIQRKHSRTLK